MALLKRDHELLKSFIICPWKKQSFREIKESSGKKSKGYVYNVIKEFEKESVLISEKVGNNIIYSLNLESEKALGYAGFLSEYAGWSGKHIPYADVESIIKKIPTDYFTLLVTGSYARGTQKKESDLDVVIICDDSKDPKKIYAELRHDAEMNIPPIHLYTFTEKEFLLMLLDKKPNYGKEIVRNNIIISGGRAYYKLVSKAIKNGFTG
jgi:predicted nucleotidyltransferase